GFHWHFEATRAEQFRQRVCAPEGRVGTGALAMSAPLVLVLMLWAAAPQSSRYPIQESETIDRVLDFSGAANHMVELDNLSGSIHVKAAPGNSVAMTAHKTVRAESQARIDDAKRDVKLDITDKAETIRIYVDGPFRCQCSDGRSGWRSSGARWDEPGYRVD